MQQVEIDVVGAEPRELGFEQPFEVLLFLNHPNRQLVSEIYLLAPAVGKRLADYDLALAAVVAERGVDIVDAGLDSAAQLLHCQLLVDMVVLADSLEAHTSVAKRRNFDIVYKFTILHNESSR